MNTWDIILGTLPAAGLVLVAMVFVTTLTNKRIDDTQMLINKRIDDTNKRIDDLRAEVFSRLDRIESILTGPTKAQR